MISAHEIITFRASELLTASLLLRIIFLLSLLLPYGSRDLAPEKVPDICRHTGRVMRNRDPLKDCDKLSSNLILVQYSLLGLGRGHHCRIILFCSALPDDLEVVVMNAISRRENASRHVK